MEMRTFAPVQRNERLERVRDSKGSLIFDINR